MAIRKRTGWSLTDGAASRLDDAEIFLALSSSGTGVVEDTAGYYYSYIGKNAGQPAGVSVANDVSLTSYYDGNYSFRRRKRSPRGNMGTIG